MTHDGTIRSAVELLRRGRVELDTGLTTTELLAVEAHWNFRFAPDHAELLRLALPVSPGWPNWRDGPDVEIRENWAALYDRLVFDVLNNGFWPASWSPRPVNEAEVERIARARLATWPKLVPIFGHRFMAAHPAPRGGPVFSIYQADAVYYGADLVDYIRRELKLGVVPRSEIAIRVSIPQWSALVESGGDSRKL